MQLTVSQDQRLSELPERQQAGLLTDAERAELSGWMQVDQTKLLQKAQALHEAVRRARAVERMSSIWHPPQSDP